MLCLLRLARIFFFVLCTYEILRNAKKTSDKRKMKELCTIGSYYKVSPALRKLNITLRKHWHKISEDQYCSKIFDRPPIVAYKNIKTKANSLNFSRTGL